MTDIEKTAAGLTPERVAMLKRRAEMIAAHPEAKTAGELAPFMGLYEREYWEWVLDKLAQEMDEAEAAAEGPERSDPEGEQ